MLDVIPAGAVALEPTELDQIAGGSIWRIVAGAAAAGFTVGRWLACALECVWTDG